MPQFKNTKLAQNNKPQKVADVPQFQQPSILEMKSAKVTNISANSDIKNQKPSNMSKEDMTTLLMRNQIFMMKDKVKDVAVMNDVDDDDDYDDEDSKEDKQREDYLEKF